MRANRALSVDFRFASDSQESGCITGRDRGAETIRSNTNNLVLRDWWLPGPQ